MIKEESKTKHIIIDCPNQKGLVKRINQTKWIFSNLSAVTLGNRVLISVWSGCGIDEIDDCLEEFGGFYQI